MGRRNEGFYLALLFRYDILSKVPSLKAQVDEDYQSKKKPRRKVPRHRQAMAPDQEQTPYATRCLTWQQKKAWWVCDKRDDYYSLTYGVAQ